METFDKTWYGVTSIWVKWEKDSVDLEIPTLPEELLIKIFSYLPQNEIGRTLPLVCWSWKEISEDSRLWKTSYFSRLPKFLRKDVLKLKVFYKEATKSLLHSRTIADTYIDIAEKNKSGEDRWILKNFMDLEASEPVTIRYNGCQKTIPMDDLNTPPYVWDFMMQVVGGETIFNRLPVIKLDDYENIRKINPFDLPHDRMAKIQIQGSDIGVVFRRQLNLFFLYKDDYGNLMVLIQCEPEECLIKYHESPKFNFNYPLYRIFFWTINKC